MHRRTYDRKGRGRQWTRPEARADNENKSLRMEPLTYPHFFLLLLAPELDSSRGLELLLDDVQLPFVSLQVDDSPVAVNLGVAAGQK